MEPNIITILKMIGYWYLMGLFISALLALDKGTTYQDLFDLVKLSFFGPVLLMVFLYILWEPKIKDWWCKNKNKQIWKRGRE